MIFQLGDLQFPFWKSLTYNKIVMLKMYQRESAAQSPYETILKLINVSWSLFTICIIELCIIQKHAI